MPDINAIARIVRKEKEEFEQMAEEEAAKTKEELEKKDQMIAVTQISNRSVLAMFQEYYPTETLEHMNIEEEKIESLAGALKVLSRNIIKSSNPIVCLGPRCYAAAKCPIQKAGVAPISSSCPVELMLIDQWELEYMEDLGVDKQSKIEIDMVRDMVEADLIDWRTSNEIAKNGIFDWNAIGMSEDNKPIYRKEEAVAIGIKLKFKARKDRIREDLMATRKIRAKFGLTKTLDPSKFAAQLQQRYNDIKQAQIEDSEEKEV